MQNEIEKKQMKKKMRSVSNQHEIKKKKEKWISHGDFICVLSLHYCTSNNLSDNY
jgi:hypothetical protein